MKLFTYPYPIVFEYLIATAIAPLSLTIAPNCSIHFIRNNPPKSDVATLILVSPEIGPDVSPRLCADFFDSRNANSTSVIVLRTDHAVAGIADVYSYGANNFLCSRYDASVMGAWIGAAVHRVRHLELSLEETTTLRFYRWLGLEESTTLNFQKWLGENELA